MYLTWIDLYLTTIKPLIRMLKGIISNVFVLVVLALMSGCTDTDRSAEVQRVLSSVKGHFVPDSRRGIFDLYFMETSGIFLLQGETDHPEALEALVDSLDRLQVTFENKVKVWPDSELGRKNWALVKISVSNMRKYPRHSDELVSQCLLGTPLKVLKKDDGWYLVQTPDRYLGWVDSGGIELKSEEDILNYLEVEKIVFTEIYGFSHQEPQKDSKIVSDLTSGNLLTLNDSTGPYYGIIYPDGRSGFVLKSESELFSSWVKGIRLDGEELVSTAEDFLGIPYLWGGTSAKAMDCSGFTKTVYYLHGMVLPRDASQQDEIGLLVDDIRNFNSLNKGDLLFFGVPASDSSEERIVHVGMWIGDMKFIHASGDVHISSFDPESQLYDPYNLDRYLHAKRLIGSEELQQLSVKNTVSGIW